MNGKVGMKSLSSKFKIKIIESLYDCRYLVYNVLGSLCSEHVLPVGHIDPPSRSRHVAEDTRHPLEVPPFSGLQPNLHAMAGIVSKVFVRVSNSECLLSLLSQFH